MIVASSLPPGQAAAIIGSSSHRVIAAAVCSHQQVESPPHPPTYFPPPRRVTTRWRAFCSPSPHWVAAAVALPAPTRLQGHCRRQSMLPAAAWLSRRHRLSLCLYRVGNREMALKPVDHIGPFFLLSLGVQRSIRKLQNYYFLFRLF